LWKQIYLGGKKISADFRRRRSGEPLAVERTLISLVRQLLSTRSNSKQWKQPV